MIAVTVVCLPFTIIPIEAQCYGCEQNSSTLKQALLEKQVAPVVISQVELASPIALFPDNQTCYEKPGFTSAYTCSTNVIPGRKVQCAYFIGSKTCEPLHLRTSGTNQTCFKDSFPADSAPQWFDMYNTLDQTVVLQNFTAYDKLNYRPYGQEGPFSVPFELAPHEKCTFPWVPVDEALSMDLNDMSMAISYNYDGQHYNVTTPSFSDTLNDTRTWQYDGNKWTFAEQNVVPVPEFPLASIVLLTSISSVILFYRIKG